MFDFNLLKDPGYFRENRLDAHSDHAYYLSAAELESGKMSMRESLNGLWKFFYAQNPGQVIPGFESPDFDCRGWRDIPVPAHIQLEGYGEPQYANVEYPWDGHEDRDLLPGDVPERFNPVGCYVKYFTLPQRMKGRRVFISFQGAESCIAVWLNGKYIGFSGDTFTPHEFELTDALVDGQNKLACRVYRWCAGSWLEDQDFLRFSGLYRDVYLFAVPQSHVWDLQVTAEPEADGTVGRLKWKAQVDAPDGAVLTVALKGIDGTVEKAVWDDDNVTAEGELAVEDPRLWSAEDPFLYDLDVTLQGTDGETEYIRQKVGFRKVEIRNSVILVNGVRVVFKGVNRHDFCGATGRAVPEEKVREALLLMKRNNINAIRTSHYPNASVLYRLADELGLYVIDECNMETHGMWDCFLRGEAMFPGDRTEWQPLLLDRVRSMVGRDRNHPCIVMWSCGNESLTGHVILEMSREFKRLDPTRLVHYEGDSHAPAEYRLREITDVESEMYTPAAKIRAYLQEHREKPFILCEYTHSMGNSNGAMHKYTELVYEEELYQGGFIWDYIDQALSTRDRFGKDTLLYGGDWGDRPTDGIFCGNGIVFADGKETPKLQEVKYNYQNIKITVEGNRAEICNRHMFTDTSAYRCVVTLEREGVETGRWEMETAVPPLSSETVTLPFELPEAPGEYAATVSFRLREDEPWAPMGYEVAFGQGVWKTEAEKVCDGGGHPELFCLSSPWNITVRGDSFQLMFSKISGELNSYKWGDTELLKAPLLPNFWRAPINNDNGNGMPQRYAQWKIASMYCRPGITRETREKNMNAPLVRGEDGSVSFTLTYDLPTNPAAACDVTYRVHPCGKVDVCMTYDPVEGLGDMPEFGMIMKLDADYDRVRFLGLGPDENYTDRREGARLGIWQYRAAENMTPYLLPQECGNRTGVRWAEITGVRGHGLKLWLNGGEFSALPWTPHEIENAAHGYELPPVCYTVLKMSAQQMGVGGDDSWGARTHEEYLLDVSGRKEFRFSFKGM